MFPAFLRFESESWEAATLGTIRTHRLRGNGLLLYLMSHGRRQGWLRLKWLLDMYRLTSHYTEVNWAELRESAVRNNLIADFQIGTNLLNQTLRHPCLQSATLIPVSFQGSIIRRICLRWLNEGPQEALAFLPMKLLRPPYKMLALSGFWPRFSYLASLVFRYPHFAHWRLPMPLLLLAAPLAPLISAFRAQKTAPQQI